MNSAPAYQRIAQALRLQISQGRWQGGDRLPSEHELTRTFEVSRNTVRQALNLLAASNLIQRHQGRGTFIAPHGLSHVLGDLRSFTQVMRDRGLEPGITSVSVTVDHAPPLEAQEFLRASRIWRVSRIRTGDQRPFSVMDSWLPDHVGSQIDEPALRRRHSLYAILVDDIGARLHEATETIRAEAASRSDADALEVVAGTPLITTYRWTSDNRGLPIEYVRSASPGDRYEYVVKLQG